MRQWALKKDGKLVRESVCDTKSGCWVYAANWLIPDSPLEHEYRRVEPYADGRRRVSKLGYTVVRVEVMEVK